MLGTLIPILMFVIIGISMSAAMVLIGRFVGPRRAGAVKEMPYESGADPIHDTKRRFDVRFYLVAISFLIFDVELLFFYPWAVSRLNPVGIEAAITQTVSQRDAPVKNSTAGNLLTNTTQRDRANVRRTIVFVGVLIFLGMVVLGLVYDWRKGVFLWR